MSLYTYLSRLFTKQTRISPDNKNVFDHHFFDRKYYVHQTSSTENFAGLLNISTHEVDNISICYHGINFMTLVNEYRCLHFIDELENPINSKLPIESIIKLCGFENSESFYHSIKSKNLSIY